MQNSFRSIGLITRATAVMGNRLFTPKNLQANQFLYLLRILEHPGITQADLATQLHVDPSTCLRAVRKLITGNYVRRQDDPANKRRKCLFPTAKAQADADQLHGYEQALLTQGTADFTPGERLMLQELLARVATNIDDLNDDPDRLLSAQNQPSAENPADFSKVKAK